jgi:hypothetical protein
VVKIIMAAVREVVVGAVELIEEGTALLGCKEGAGMRGRIPHGVRVDGMGDWLVVHCLVWKVVVVRKDVVGVERLVVECALCDKGLYCDRVARGGGVRGGVVGRG